MNNEFVVPGSNRPLKYDENKGELSGENICYKVEGSIPIFNPEENFDGHWEENLTDDIPESKRNVSLNFLAPVFEYARSHPGILKILDAGCGDGVHLETLVNKDLDSKFHCIGVDLSLHALQNIKKNISKKNCQFAQCDIAQLPFSNNYFDVTFSYGVIGYTNNPFLSFKELVDKTKPNGIIGIWMFPKSGGLGGLLFSFIRKLCKFVGKSGTKLLANIIVPFLPILPTRSKLNLSNSSWKQCREIVLVNIAPQNLYFPTKEELFKWFDECNIERMEESNLDPITIWGVKK